MLSLAFHKDPLTKRYFNLFINGLVFFIRYKNSVLSNYADENIFATGKNKEDIKSSLS